ncbi:MAG: type-4 uracil-DNA glycosylase [Nanopusillaceae archaeon]
MHIKEKIEEIANQIKSCKKCPLHLSKINYVPGEGNPENKIIFIGEAPGSEEDKQGRPFVGKAGKYLTEQIEKILGIKREEIYITNLIKCRPPKNRDPKEEEIKNCSEWLIKQIEEIKPNLIVTLGRHSTKFIMEYFGLNFTNIMKERGKIYVINKWNKDTYIIPTLHPAAVLYHANWKSLFESDFEKIRDIIKKDTKTKKQTILDYFNMKKN